MVWKGAKIEDAKRRFVNDRLSGDWQSAKGAWDQSPHRNSGASPNNRLCSASAKRSVMPAI